MKQLTGTDSMFLQFERGNNFMHVASFAIYDPSTAPGGGVRFKDVLRFFASRVAQFPQFRRRIVSLPLSLDRPYWVEASSIDVEFHVRHIALPHPGDWRQLCIQVARLHSRPLDRSKPLWEAYVIEGLHNVEGVPPGSFALYTKMHHAIVDGESGTEIMKALHSLTPESLDAATEEHAAARVFHADREPTLVELYSRALIHNLESLPSLARFSLGTARRLAGAGAQAFTRYKSAQQGGTFASLRGLLSGDISSLLPRMPPATRFSGEVSAHRVFETVEVPMDEFRQIRKQAGAGTVNDQFLCIVGGALRMYLSAKNELPDASLVAMVPLTLRGADKSGDVGNQVGATAISVHTEIEEPVERLHAIVRDAQSAKALTDAVGKELLRDLLEHVPSFVSSPLLRNVKLPALSLVVSNVRGPDVPLYMAGAKLVKYAPVSIAVDGMGLNITGFSYAGTMCICAISCREMLPDPGFFADCLRTSFEQLKEAAAREAAFRATSTETGREAQASASDGAKAGTKKGTRKARAVTGTPPTPKGTARTKGEVSKKGQVRTKVAVRTVRGKAAKQAARPRAVGAARGAAKARARKRSTSVATEI
jgi:diacylglycerol O-acyltransferase / wax synthase